MRCRREASEQASCTVLLCRDEAKERLKDQPDGSFLVRDARAQGDYTLTIM